MILNLVYYKCPMLCNMVLNAQTQALREIPWTPGNEFEVVTISIDPAEGFDVAEQKKKVQLGAYDRPAPGWHFLRITMATPSVWPNRSDSLSLRRAHRAIRARGGDHDPDA